MTNEPILITRRDFIRGTIGATLGTSMFGMGWAVGSETTAPSSLVTVVRNKDVMNADRNVDFKVLQKMLDQSIVQLTGKKDSNEAWSTIITPEDTFGLVTTGHLYPTHD